GPHEDGAQGLPPGNVPLRPEGLPLLVREDPGRGATGSRRPAGTERRPVLSPRRPPTWSPSRTRIRCGPEGSRAGIGPRLRPSMNVCTVRRLRGGRTHLEDAAPSRSLCASRLATMGPGHGAGSGAHTLGTGPGDLPPVRARPGDPGAPRERRPVARGALPR